MPKKEITVRESNKISDYENSIFLGNYYGRHDGYDGSVFSIYGICKTITASKGGIADILVEAENE